MEQKNVSTLPFGKRVKCGNYYVLKTMRALPGNELKKLRNNANIPKDMQKHLQRSSLPCITVSTMVDSWKVSFMVGMTMFNAIDEIPVFHDSKGNYEYMGEQALNLANIINFWACFTSTVGDEEFQADCIKAMSRYLDRMSEKNKAPLSKEETEKICDEEIEREKVKATLINMLNEMNKKDGTR